LMAWAVYRKRKSKKSGVALLGLIFVGLVLLVFANRFLHNLIYYRELRSMSPQEISAIAVDGKSLSKTNDLATLTDGFNDVQWFAYNHGGVAAPVSIVVHYKSGAQSRYVVRFYNRQYGAVVEFSRQFANGVSISYGEAFCRRLPDAFEDVNLPLPRN
jgi:hypothetical protein